MARIKSRIITSVILTLFICTLTPFSAFAEEDNGIFPYQYKDTKTNTVIKLYHEWPGELKSTDEKVQIGWSEPDSSGNTHMDTLKFFEQSNYADLLPNHYYYRTVTYRYYLTVEPMLFVDVDEKNPDLTKTYKNIVESSTDYNCLDLQQKEAGLMRELIRQKYNSEFNEKHVTSQAQV